MYLNIMTMVGRKEVERDRKGGKNKKDRDKDRKRDRRIYLAAFYLAFTNISYDDTIFICA